MANVVSVPIRADTDVLQARQQARTLAAPLRFSSSELTLVATAISEVARNIVQYATRGNIILRIVKRGERRGLQVVAEDNGPGIAIEAQGKLFERFYRAPGTENIPGTGLGLAIVKSVASKNRGSVYVRSRQCQGSTFGMILPIEG